MGLCLWPPWPLPGSSSLHFTHCPSLTALHFTHFHGPTPKALDCRHPQPAKKPLETSAVTFSEGFAVILRMRDEQGSSTRKKKKRSATRLWHCFSFGLPSPFLFGPSQKAPQGRFFCDSLGSSASGLLGLCLALP